MVRRLGGGRGQSSFRSTYPLLLRLVAFFFAFVLCGDRSLRPELTVPTGGSAKRGGMSLSVRACERARVAHVSACAPARV